MTTEEELMSFDKESYITDLEDFPYHIMDAYELPGNLKVEKKEIDKIVVCGMGGSGIAGDILKVFLDDSTIPVFTNKRYDLPGFVNSKTLVFTLSYSGNTEETLECFKEAMRKGCQIVSIASGGKLKDLAKKHKTVFVQIPAKRQPRAMLGYLFFTMLKLLENYHIIKDASAEVKSLSNFLKSNMFKEKGHELAKNLLDKVPLIYASDAMYPVAMRFKTQINENVKIHAFYNTFSEMNHNEIVGFTDMYTKYHVVIFGSESDHPRIKKRFDIFKKIVKAKKVNVTQMNFTGKSKLKQIFTAIHIGDWTSYYMALYNEIDPSPVVVIEDLKKQLKR